MTRYSSKYSSKDSSKDSSPSYSSPSKNSYIIPNINDEACNSPNLDAVNLPEANQICVEHRGLTRCWYIFVPESAQSSVNPVPLVFDLHGYNLCAVYSSNYTGWGALAKEKGFIVVWPQGNMDSNYSDGPCWDFGGCCCMWNGTSIKGEIDDIGFLRQVAATTIKEVQKDSITIDMKRIYFGGHSNGCIMAQAMAALSSDLVAAVCCHAGMLLASPPSSLVATPVQVIMGNLDFMMKGSVAMGFPGAMQNLEVWGDINNCTSNLTQENNLYRTHQYYNCSKNVEARMVELYNIGHWPYLGMDPNTSYSVIGAPPGAVVPSVDTTLLSWEFCSRFSSESIPNIPEIVPLVSPNSFVSSCSGTLCANWAIFFILLTVLLS